MSPSRCALMTNAKIVCSTCPAACWSVLSSWCRERSRFQDRRAFDPRSAEELALAASLEDTKTRGSGTRIARYFSDELHYLRKRPGSVITLRLLRVRHGGRGF